MSRDKLEAAGKEDKEQQTARSGEDGNEQTQRRSKIMAKMKISAQTVQWHERREQSNTR